MAHLRPVSHRESRRGHGTTAAVDGGTRAAVAHDGNGAAWMPRGDAALGHETRIDMLLVGPLGHHGRRVLLVQRDVVGRGSSLREAGRRVSL